jgi:hypothetical protein
MAADRVREISASHVSPRDPRYDDQPHSHD